MSGILTVIKANELSDNFISIDLVKTMNGTLENNTCNHNVDFGVSLENCTGIKVVNNGCTNNSQHSIEIWRSADCLIENNTCNDDGNTRGKRKIWEATTPGTIPRQGITGAIGTDRTRMTTGS